MPSYQTQEQLQENVSVIEHMQHQHLSRADHSGPSASGLALQEQATKQAAKLQSMERQVSCLFFILNVRSLVCFHVCRLAWKETYQRAETDEYSLSPL